MARGLPLALLALLVWPGVAVAGVTINEVLVNLPGDDTGFEYVELYNDGSSSMDLSGWTLQVATRPTSWSTKVTLASGTTIPAGGFLVLGESMVPEADVVTGTLAMGNATSSGDGVRLVDASEAVVDTVVYGPNNSDGFLDDSGAVAAPAPKPGEGDALGRKPDGADTQDSSADFVLLDAPTPGSTNVVVLPPACDLAAISQGMVVNEFLANPAGSDDVAFEYVELYNATGGTVDISGWTVEGGTSSYGTLGAVPEGTLLAASQFYVIGGNSVPGVDVELQRGLPNATSSSDAIRLVDCEGGILDTVVFGAPNSDGWVDDGGSLATSLAPKPPDDLPVGRRYDGEDSDRSGEDFIVHAAQTPGEANPEPPPCELGELVINELLVDPEGTDSEAAMEWIELYNAGSQPITVSGWGIEVHTEDFSGSPDLVLPDIELAAGGHLLLGQENVLDADVLGVPTLGNGTQSSVGIQLTDCEGAIVDTVVYGGPNEKGIVDDTGSVAVSLAPAPPSAASIARVRDGYDTDQSKLDFVVDTAPTPGLPNPEGEPVVCAPASGDTVVLNEVMVNPEGEDAGFEWIELFNPTDADISVAGWEIVHASNAEDLDLADASVPGGVVVPAGGFLVLGATGVLEADVVMGLSLGNGSGGDAVILQDCEGTRIDSVLYGPDNEDQITDDTGAVVEPYITTVSSGASLARAVDGDDSDSASDWYASAYPTPGLTNERASGENPEPGGCACGQKDPDDLGDEPSGCGSDVSSPVMPMFALVFAFGLLRRRRRG